MKFSFLITLMLLSSGVSIAQNDVNDVNNIPSFKVGLTDEKITLDGILDESVWKDLEVATDFYQTFPKDDQYATGDTEIKMCYDNDNLYVAVISYSQSDQFVIQNLKRDYSFSANDNVTLLFDTYNDQTNALVFGMNPAGARREATVIRGGRFGADFDNSWDIKWDGASKIYENYWICEMAIPFKSLRYDSESEKWRFQCYRNDAQCNEFSGWIKIPREKILMDLSCMGDMIWEGELPKSRKNISLIPYTTFGVTRDFEDVNESSAQTSIKFGGDVKYSVSSSLNLDLTFNPDFSQVEVDRQVTNLDRFEIFFPERRQFFLENADLFSSFGVDRSNPFFSRRIGISRDTLNDVNVENTIYFGARLSGKLDETTRVGLLNMQTASQIENDLPSFNYTVAALEKTVFGQSNIAAIVVNKQGFNTENFEGTNNSHNRLVGLEYRLGTRNNVWSGKFGHHLVFSPEEQSHKFQNIAFVQRNTKHWRIELANIVVGNGYNAEVGFVPRKDIMTFSPEVDFRIFPKIDLIAQHTIGFDYEMVYKLGEDDNSIQQDFGLVDQNLNLYWSIQFENRSRLNFRIDYNDILLLDDFDPTRIQEDDVFLNAGEQFSFTQFSINWRSNPRADFTFNLNPTVGSFFSGFRSGMAGNFDFRFPPKLVLGLNFNYNYIDLNRNFKQSQLWLIGPRVEITFSKELFFTNFFQYNNQQDNININSRLQWRFAPVSDLFLVYTDNYLTNPFDQFGSRNRAVFLKLSYWLNL